jgi:hypothetical protein
MKRSHKRQYREIFYQDRSATVKREHRQAVADAFATEQRELAQDPRVLDCILVLDRQGIATKVSR